MNKLSNFFNESLSGKKILISGGSTGMDGEIALLLTSLGANCLIFGRTQESLDEIIIRVQSEDSNGSCRGRC